MTTRHAPLTAFHWAILAGVLFAAGTARAEPKEESKPNVIFILVDDMGWKDLGCQGSTFYLTPNIDRLASQGMRFTNAYAACPVCSPTRASIMTGKYPARLHLTDWLPGMPDRPEWKLRRPKIVQFLPREEVTLAKALKPHGYVSANIGKWHLGGQEYYPEKHGFDVNVGGSARAQTPTFFFPYKTDKMTSPTIPGGKEGEYLTDRLTQEAENFIAKHKDQPFFLYLAHYAVHLPIEAKKDKIAKYEARVKPGQEQNNATYAAMIESLDESVGSIMRQLDRLKIADHTIIFFTSDNGGLSEVGNSGHKPSTSNAPLRDGKGYLHEGGIRVPGIVRWPGVVKPGGECAVPITSVDYFPTILEMTGVKDSKRAVDGVSLLPLLKQSGHLGRDAIFWHYPHYNSHGGKPSAAVRKGDLKLIEFHEDGTRELYDLKEDIGEQKDLSAQMPEKSKELHQLLIDWRKSVHAQMPTPNPDYDPVKKK